MVNILTNSVAKASLISSHMHPADIKAALSRKGITLTSLARELNVTPQAVSQTVHRERHSCSRRIQAEVATKLELPIEEVFPESRE